MIKKNLTIESNKLTTEEEDDDILILISGDLQLIDLTNLNTL